MFLVSALGKPSPEEKSFQHILGKQKKCCTDTMKQVVSTNTGQELGTLSKPLKGEVSSVGKDCEKCKCKKKCDCCGYDWCCCCCC